MQPPVRGIRGVTDQRKRVETDIVFSDDRAQFLPDPFSLIPDGRQPCFQFGQIGQTGRDDDPFVRIGCQVGMNRIEIIFGSAEKLPASGEIVDQFLKNERVSEKDEDIPDESQQEPEELSFDPVIPKLFKGMPGFFSQKEFDDLRVFRRGIIVGNFPLCHDLYRSNPGMAHRASRRFISQEARETSKR